MDVFIGRQDCSVDEKRRFSLPPKYRAQFGVQTGPEGITHSAVLIPWYGGSLAAFPVARWNEIQERILALDYTTPDFLDAKRVCLSRMELVRTDPEGRLTISPLHHTWLRLSAKGKSRIMVVGMTQHLEIWNETDWASVEVSGVNTSSRPEQDGNYDTFLESLMRAGLEAKERADAAHRTPPPAETSD